MSLHIYLFFREYRLKQAELEEVGSMSGILNVISHFLSYN